MTDRPERQRSSEPFGIHDGSRTAAEFRGLIDELSAAIEVEVARLERDEGPLDLDRAKIKAAFGRAGFAGEYFGLDFDAPIEGFLAALEDLHTDDLPLYVRIYERYPSGVVEGELVSLQELIDELGLEDGD